ncbi:NTP pyrophosphohydrolase [Kitasatospora sp. DSM 101779]|uniref:NTP pyrophosphohydrolase n=1 Tax=Kitasatospora sp. DSM 101779 TaxID=2853165 RepID=UPI0021DAF269|nr:NTP pyrophosphohydrolase [Kitasatospora sp. DSM 101779]MCU7826650.1 NTP pyrophosphohydrolase [Kitasatospora sp. DSM 101779]
MSEKDGGGPPAVVPLLVVDAANVVGSVPDGWWRDRRAAAERLRDALVPLAGQGLGDGADLPPWARTGPLEVVLVVEGAARGVPGLPQVRVVGAAGSGDDRVVALVEEAVSADPHRSCLVVTADRGLRARVTALGALVTGPRAVRPV